RGHPRDRRRVVRGRPSAERGMVRLRPRRRRGRPGGRHRWLWRVGWPTRPGLLLERLRPQHPAAHRCRRRFRAHRVRRRARRLVHPARAGVRAQQARRWGHVRHRPGLVPAAHVIAPGEQHRPHDVPAVSRRTSRPRPARPGTAASVTKGPIMTSTRINRRTLLGGAAGLGAAAVGAGWITTSARARAAAELPNPGFEELTDGWPTRWRAFNDASRANITIVTDPVHGGANALRIDDDTATGIGVRSAEVPVEEGTFYEGSIFALVETGSFVLYLEFWNAAGTRITTATRTFGDVAGWQQIRIRAQAPSGAVAATVLPYSAQNNTGSAVFDDAGIATVEVT